MPKYLSTVYKDSNKIVVDSTTNIRPNLQSTKSLAPPCQSKQLKKENIICVVLVLNQIKTNKKDGGQAFCRL